MNASHTDQPRRSPVAFLWNRSPVLEPAVALLAMYLLPYPLVSTNRLTFLPPARATAAPRGRPVAVRAMYLLPYPLVSPNRLPFLPPSRSTTAPRSCPCS